MSELSVKVKIGTKANLVEVAELVEVRAHLINKNISGTYRINYETPEGEIIQPGPTIPFQITNLSTIKYAEGELIETTRKDKNGKVTKEAVYAKGNEIKQEGSNMFDEFSEAMAKDFDKKMVAFLTELVKPLKS